jgi:hypothetical protein
MCPALNRSKEGAAMRRTERFAGVTPDEVRPGQAKAAAVGRHDAAPGRLAPRVGGRREPGSDRHPGGATTKLSLAMRMAEARLSQLATALCSRARVLARLSGMGFGIREGGWLAVYSERSRQGHSDQVLRSDGSRGGALVEVTSPSRRARWDCPHGNGRRRRADRCVQRRGSGNRRHLDNLDTVEL